MYTPDELWDKAVEYFQWCEKNPWKESKPFGTGHTATINHPRALTETGFRIFANFSKGTWDNYCSGKDGFEDYLGVTTHIKEVIYTQKFEGAAAGFFNANIIARDLGLSEKKDVAVTGVNFNVPPGTKDLQSEPIE